jgi:hypothetical protein
MACVFRVLVFFATFAAFLRDLPWKSFYREGRKGTPAKFVKKGPAVVRLAQIPLCAKNACSG